MDQRREFRSGFTWNWNSFSGSATLPEDGAANGFIDRQWSTTTTTTTSRMRSRSLRPAGLRNRRITSDCEKPWIPVTKLGKLVKDGVVKSIEDIYLHSLSIKEYQITDYLLPRMHDEVLKIVPVQKLTRAGIRIRFKAFVAVGDRNGHVGVGVKCAKEVANAIRGALYNAKTSIIPVRRAYWGEKCGRPHTLPCKVTGRVGDIQLTLYPAPRGCGLVAPPITRKILLLCGVQDCFTSCSPDATLSQLSKATYLAIQRTYFYVPPCERDPQNSNDDRFQLHWQFLTTKLTAIQI
ncbi:hypothetical protein AB6A40_005101 [Gnathostoma spinigerum]|uniref:Small ribosomal subunit protein uS5 n=1 Tax=Gnathostoma spinigerum TaxID=75299 RepID=A0ABD6ENY8_9BILA